jgi:tetratricopeptide (TPR) repeat protein
MPLSGKALMKVKFLANFCLSFFLSIAVLSPWSSISAQDDSLSDIDAIEIPEARRPLCFGFSDIEIQNALAICDALELDENVKARELSEQWIRQEPNSPAAQFALAEVLFKVEGNLPRALFHLNRAEEFTNYNSLEDAFNSGNVQWHYLTLSQLSYVHQLMGDQLKSLEYLDKISEVYGQDMESFRGWPLIKLKQFDAARESANLVLENSVSDRERARAWNTLCAVELASLAPIESLSACDRAIDEDEDIANSANDYDTVYLTNASEVSLSLLQMEQAEEYIDRASRYLNPQSVADPWIYKLFLTLNQGRFDDARSALDRMLIWREQQEPIVNVMNRAEHFLVSASFLMVAGYAEDAAKLTQTALNQPDRNGSYSADDAQKDSFAALLNMMANRTEYQIQLEALSTLDFTDSIAARIRANSLRLRAWRAERRAASLFADFEVLQNRLRPYAPLDVHIPEWVEPEIIQLIGSGVMKNILNQARANGVFQLNEGYYYSYLTEIAAIESDRELVVEAGSQALNQLPQQEVLLRARVAARVADANWRNNNFADALTFYEIAYQQDPSIFRRLALEIPASITGDSSQFADQVSNILSRSPRFKEDSNGFQLEVQSNPDLSVCLKSRTGSVLSCYTMATAEDQSSKWNAQELTRLFYSDTFGLGYDISKAQRSILLGSSVILSSQTNSNLRNSRDAFLVR